MKCNYFIKPVSIYYLYYLCVDTPLLLRRLQHSSQHSRGHPKASHFSKWAVLIGKWVVLNPKMGSSKIEFWRENAELPNVKVSKHSIINI
jgi:hypothetical protein